MNAKRPHDALSAPYTPRQALYRPRPTVRTRPADLIALLRTLTPRDQWLMEMLHEHRVLTSTQILRLAFGTRRTANRRLAQLYTSGIVNSFRPLIRTGSAPEHYTLGPAGAAILAARTGQRPHELGWRADHTVRVAYSPRLGHDLAVNDFHTRLAAEYHRHHGRRLDLWLSELTCAHLWGDWIRPDAYAHYREDGATVPFFLEYDTGTESLSRVAGKLTGYAALARGTGSTTVLLIPTSSPERELDLHQRLVDNLRLTNLHVATTSTHWPNGQETAGPRDMVWMPIRPAIGPSTLAGLARLWRDLTPATPPAGDDAHEALFRAVPPLPPGTRT